MHAFVENLPMHGRNKLKFYENLPMHIENKLKFYARLGRKLAYAQ